MDIKEEFRKRRMRQILIIPPIFLVMIPLLMAEKGVREIYGLPINYFVYLAIGLIFLALIFSLKNWRCPACNSYLGKEINPRFCSKCGTQLRGK